MIILALPSGKLIDIIGKKKPIMASFILWAAAIVLLVYGNFTRLIISMVLVGILMVLIHSAVSSLEAGLVPKEHRGKVNGSKGFFRAIAASVGQFTGGWLYDSVNHQIPFLIQIVLVMIPFMMVFLWIDEDEEMIH
jgi:MFS family permease